MPQPSTYVKLEKILKSDSAKAFGMLLDCRMNEEKTRTPATLGTFLLYAQDDEGHLEVKDTVTFATCETISYADKSMKLAIQDVIQNRNDMRKLKNTDPEKYKQYFFPLIGTQWERLGYRPQDIIANFKDRINGVILGDQSRKYNLSDFF